MASSSSLLSTAFLVRSTTSSTLRLTGLIRSSMISACREEGEVEEMRTLTCSGKVAA